MARHGKRRSYRRKFNLRKVRIATSITVGALAAKDVTATSLTGTSSSTYRLVSVDFFYGLSDLGAVADDGQEFGLAHSDYTAAEIEECLEAGTSIDAGDKIANEKANRLVRSVGVMVGAPGTGAGLNFNNGNNTKTRLNWLMTIGDSLQLWIRNSSATVYTTGATIDVIGSMYVKDSA